MKPILVGDTLYFDADDGNNGRELWAHDTSNQSTWQVADISSGVFGSEPGEHMKPILVGDRLYFDADDGNSGTEMWVHDTSNHSTWKVADINNRGAHSYPGLNIDPILVGDTIYFDASGDDTGTELWAMRIEHSITYN